MPEITIVNGLAATKHRKAFVRAVASSRSRVVRFHSTGEAWDQVENVKVTARLDEAFRHDWVEPVPDEDLWPGAEPRTRVIYFRVTRFGRVALGVATDINKENSE